MLLIYVFSMETSLVLLVTNMFYMIFPFKHCTKQHKKTDLLPMHIVASWCISINSEIRKANNEGGGSMNYIVSEEI